MAFTGSLKELLHTSGAGAGGYGRFDHSRASVLIINGNDVLPAMVPHHQLLHVPQWLTGGVEVGVD